MNSYKSSLLDLANAPKVVVKNKEILSSKKPEFADRFNFQVPDFAQVGEIGKCFLYYDPENTLIVLKTVSVPNEMIEYKINNQNDFWIFRREYFNQTYFDKKGIFSGTNFDSNFVPEFATLLGKGNYWVMNRISVLFDSGSFQPPKIPLELLNNCFFERFHGSKKVSTFPQPKNFFNLESLEQTLKFLSNLN